MFLSYALLYASFVALNLASPLSMDTTVCLGLNLATVFGFALILVAFAQALIYDAICRKREAAVSEDETEGEG